MENERDARRQPFEDGRTIREANPVENQMNINQATNHISELMRRGMPGSDDGVPESPVPTKAPKIQRDDKRRPVEDINQETDEQDLPNDTVAEDDQSEPGEVNEKGEEALQESYSEESTGENEAGEAETETYELEPEALAEFLGVDETDLVLGDEGGLSIRTKVDGKTTEVSLRDLKDGFQLAKASQKRMQDLAEERKQFDAHRTEQTKQLEDQQQYLGAALQAIEQQYASDFQAVDWQRLQTEDPHGYATRRKAFDQRMLQVNQFKQQFAQQLQTMQKQQEETMQQKYAEGFRKLNETFEGKPYVNSAKWDDAEKDKLSQFMVNSGMDPKDLGKVDNWLVFKWARDSMLREREIEAGEKTKKRIVKIPKVSKPGTAQRKDKKTTKQRNLADAKAKQRKAAKTRYDPLNRRSNLNESAELISQIIRGD